MQLFVKVILDYLQCTSFVFLEYEGFLVQCMREKPRLKSRGLKLNWSLACSAAALTWLLCYCVLKIEISESHHDPRRNLTDGVKWWISLVLLVTLFWVSWILQMSSGRTTTTIKVPITLFKRRRDPGNIWDPPFPIPMGVLNPLFRKAQQTVEKITTAIWQTEEE